MAFTVEDGTIVEGANALVDVAFADTYFADRGNDDWTGEDSDKETAIILATDYFERRFGDKLAGFREEEDQALSFPRTDLYVRGVKVEGVPRDIKYAISEYAVRAMTSALAPDPEYDDSGFPIRSKTEVVGPIEESVSYYGSPIPLGNRKFPIVDALITKYLGGRGGVYR